MNARFARALFASLIALALSAAITGCGPDYDRTELTGVRTSPLGGRVDTSRIEVPAGMIIAAHIVPYDDEDEEMELTVRSQDPNILDVARVVTKNDYAFIGQRPGSTYVELRADGRLVLTIEAVVTEQPRVP